MKRTVPALLLLALAAPAAWGRRYIEVPYSLGRLVAESTNILVVQVEKVDKDNNRILYRKIRDLKGTHPTDVLRHNIGKAGFHPREWQNVMAWAEPGKLAVFMYNGGASETCIDTYWYQAYGGGADWGMSHAEPFLNRSFAGKPEKLAMAIEEILAGREVIVPAMVDGDKNTLHLRSAKVQRLKASLKLMDYNAARDFIGWGSEDFRRITHMPGFSHLASLTRVDPDARGIAPADIDGDGDADVCLYGETKVVVVQVDGAALAEASLPYAGGARGAAWEDYNADGKLDLLLAAPGGPRLFTNLGKTFRDDSALLPREPYYNVTAAAWMDADGDGRSDILVANGFLGLRLYRNPAAAAPAKVKPPVYGPWHYIGPFDNTGQKGFDAVYPPEKEINLGAKYPGKGAEAVWKKDQNWPDGAVHNLAIFPKPEQNVWSAVYLYREIDVERDMEVQASFGSDDTLTVWLNGQRLIAQNVYRAPAPDQDFAKLSLKKGKNKLLLKVCQGEGGYAFYFAAKEPESAGGSPFQDVSEKFNLGIDGLASRAKGDHLAIADVDGDGRPDALYSAAEGILLRNTPKGFTADQGSGIKYRTGGVVPAFGDYDGDGDVDLFAGGRLFRNEGKGTFKDVTAEAGLRALANAVGAAWADLFKKGKPDLVVACVGGSNRYFRNLGNGKFQDAGQQIGLVGRILNSRAAAGADVNKDGVLDLVFNNEGQDPFILLGDPNR